MLRPAISIIVPIYNSSKYLTKCLDSILCQTFTNIEVILVHDCSPDPKDEEICKKYSELDERITFIKHTNNLGQGGARNTGIKMAKSDYIGFVDSDDFIHQNLYEEMMTLINQTKSDIVHCNVVAQTDNSKVIEYINEQERIARSNFTISNIFFIVRNFCVNKVYKKTLFTHHNIWFQNHMYFEDLAIMPQLVFFAKKITHLNKYYYFYIQHQNSSFHSSKNVQKNLNDLLGATATLQGFLQKNHIYEKYKKEFYLKINQTIYHYFNHIKTNKLIKDKANKHLFANFLVQFSKTINLADYLLIVDDKKIFYLVDILFSQAHTTKLKPNMKVWEMGKYMSKKLYIHSLLRVIYFKSKILFKQFYAKYRS